MGGWARRLDLWQGLRHLLGRREIWAALPALMLAAFWLFGEGALLVMALLAPLVLMLGQGSPRAEPGDSTHLPDFEAGLALRPQLLSAMDRILRDLPVSGLQTGCLVIQFDEAETLLDRHGRATQAEILSRSAERLCAALRGGDVVARLEGGGLAVVLAPQKRLDLETLVQLAARLQASLSAPISLNAARIYVTCSIGFCLGSAAPDATGHALLNAAQIAADEALRNGPGAIRVWSPDMPSKRAERDAMRATLESALDEGQILAHFQPQIDARTGAVTGFEALARWHHPERGIIPPGEFLPAIGDAGLSERLAEIMLFHALTALTRWDRAGLPVGTIGVNFSAAELRNPRLVEKLQWELDRFDLPPSRLCVEILESVIAASDDDILVRNIAALSRLGCGIDLDDFGTGHASITNIRRFAVRRLKIDRSFVSHVDSDREQQRIVGAILSMAEKFDLETLAEGVETPAELAQLQTMGCGQVQGFGIAKPMTFDQASEWMLARRRGAGSTLRRASRLA